MNKNLNLLSAKIYSSRFGWAVLPLHSIRGIQDRSCTCNKPNCSSPGKHPLTINGCRDATKNIAKIAEWWHRWPFANVGIATGEISGFFVLDVDGTLGEMSLETLEAEHGKLPNTVESLTGGGGRHILFKHPNQPLKNRVALSPGLDVRSDGGYCVVSPSSHISGRRYEWELSSRPGEVPLAEAPQWLLKILVEPTESNRQAKTPDEWRNIIENDIQKGQRNATLTALCGHLFRCHVNPYVVRESLKLWNVRHCKPPIDNEELEQIIESIAAREIARRTTNERK